MQILQSSEVHRNQLFSPLTTVLLYTAILSKIVLAKNSFKQANNFKAKNYGKKFLRFFTSKQFPKWIPI